MMQSFRTVRIGLLWHSLNSDNLGVGALTLANIEILRETADRSGIQLKFLVLGWADPRPYYCQADDIEVVGLRMKDFLNPFAGLYHHLRRCDLVFDIGAGDSFADIYGLKRFGTILGSKILTLAARRPLILCPQTIGPFTKPWNARASLAIMKRAYSVSTRDDLSTKFLRDLGFSGRIIEASDVALRLPYTPRKKTPSKVQKVGINVSGLLFNGGYTRDNMFGLRSSYADLIRSILQWLSNEDIYEVHLVPHVISDTIEVEDDYRVNLQLAAEFPNVVLAPKFKNPIEAKSYIADLDFFAGARMHACIAAFSSGVPVLPMAYSRKFKGLFASLGYNALADCQSETSEAILDLFKKALFERDELRDQIDICLARGLDRLREYEKSVEECLNAVSK